MSKHSKSYTYRGSNIYPATGRARANGFRWEVFTVRMGFCYSETLSGARELIRMHGGR